jgi:hypothetical protein
MGVHNAINAELERRDTWQGKLFSEDSRLGAEANDHIRDGSVSL